MKKSITLAAVIGLLVAASACGDGRGGLGGCTFGIPRRWPPNGRAHINSVSRATPNRLVPR